MPSPPLIGNISAYARDRNAFIKRGYAAHGPIFSFRLGPKPVVALLSPEFQPIFSTATDKTLSIDKPYESLAAIFGKVAFLALKALIGFGGGKHKCAGMNFAINEMMVITALTLQQRRGHTDAR